MVSRNDKRAAVSTTKAAAETPSNWTPASNSTMVAPTGNVGAAVGAVTTVGEEDGATVGEYVGTLVTFHRGLSRLAIAPPDTSAVLLLMREYSLKVTTVPLRMLIPPPMDEA